VTIRQEKTHAKSTSLEAVSHGEDGVGGLSRLRDEDADVVSEDGTSPVEEVARELDVDGHLRELLKDRPSLQIAACESGLESKGGRKRDEEWTHSNTRVVRCSTGDETDSSTSADDVEVRLETSEGDGSGVEVNSSSHGVDD
jgi:hypothetical protein